MGEHKPGTMDVSTQQKTFNGFINWMVWGAVIVVIVLIFLAIVGT